MNLFANCLALAAMLKGLALIALLTAILSDAVSNLWIEENFPGYSTTVPAPIQSKPQIKQENNQAFRN